MKRIFFVLAGALILALPAAAMAATTGERISDAADQTTRDVTRTARDAKDSINQNVREMRQDVRDQKDEATMRNIERKEDKTTTGEYISDAGVTAKVKSEMLAQKGLDSLDIKVVTVDGAVTLMGDVNNQSQIDLAGKTARAVGGVKSVDNQLRVKLK